MKSKIISIGSYTPNNIVTNQDLEKRVDTTDEWIVSRTGIKERPIADDSQATSDLAYEAAKIAIERAKIDKNDIDLINEFKKSDVGKNSISFEKLNIRETLPIIKDMNLMISNDTSWSHIAVALKVKTLTLFMDSPVIAYGRYSSRMITVEPEGEKDTMVRMCANVW